MLDGELLLIKARLVVMLNDLLLGEGKLRYILRFLFIYNEYVLVSNNNVVY